MKWRERGYDHKQCYDEKGRIWGEVIRPVGSSDYLASHDGKPIGPYIDMRSAQIAIERVHREAHRKPRKPKNETMAKAELSQFCEHGWPVHMACSACISQATASPTCESRYSEPR